MSDVRAAAKAGRANALELADIPQEGGDSRDPGHSAEIAPSCPTATAVRGITGRDARESISWRNAP